MERPAMIAFLLAFVLGTSMPQPIAVELVEVNHYHDSHNGEHVFSQLIFYEWSTQRKRFDIREWRLIKSESMYPVSTRNGWFLRWHDDGVMREVKISSLRETWTKHDPELIERDYLPQDQRLPLFVNETTDQRRAYLGVAE
jgi:hypothetical protein